MGGNKNSEKSKAKQEDVQPPEMADEQLTIGAVNTRVDGLQHTLTDHGTSLLELQRQGRETTSTLTLILAKLGITSSNDTESVTVATDSDTAFTPSANMSTTSSSNSAAARSTTSSRSRGDSISFAEPVASFNTPRHNGADGYAPPPGKPNFSIKPEELGRFDGTPEETELFIADITAIYESEPEPAYLPLWEQAILRALPRTLRGSARLWFATLDDRTRAKLTTLREKGGWFAQLRAHFGATPAIVRQQARQRTWDPDSETILHYTFVKVALMKTAWRQLEDKDCITDIVDGLPIEIRQVLRVPLLRDQRIDELRDELRVQETYWRERTGRPLQKSQGNDSTPAPQPGWGSLTQPSPLTPATYVQQTAFSSSRAGTFGRSRRGKSIRDDFDPSRLHYAPHPVTGKRTMAYRVPDIDETMWCNRPCRQCKGDHFDFAHDHCRNNTVYTADVDDDYPVTTGEEAVDTPPSSF